MNPTQRKLHSNEHWNQVREWFEHCRDLSSSEREQFLAFHETKYPDEVSEVRSLLGTAQSETSVPKLLTGPPPATNEGEYEILKPLGSGGMAEVFLARWRGPTEERFVAVKCLHANLMNNQDFLELFRFEVQLNRILRHPNIVRMYDFRFWRQRYLMALEYVPGRTLWELVQSSKTGSLLPFSAAAYLFSEVAKALVYAHSLRHPSTGEHLAIVHRDVTPGNIFLGFDGSVRLMDFGIAKAKTRLRITAPGLVRGTIPYLSPEQLRGEEAGQSSDLYALAAVFVESLTGSSFNSRDYLNKSGPNPFSLLDPDTPPALVSLLKKALSEKAEDRFESVAHMLWQMRPILSKELLSEGCRVLVQALDRSFPGMAKAASEDTNLIPSGEHRQPASPSAPVRQVRLAPESGTATVAFKKRRDFRKLAYGLAGIAGLFWIGAFGVYVKALWAPVRGKPTFRPGLKISVYSLQGEPGGCLVELSSYPPGAQVRMDRSWFGGTTPTVLNLPCERDVLLTLTDDMGSAHYSLRATRAVEERMLTFSADPLRRAASLGRLMPDFHRWALRVLFK